MPNKSIDDQHAETQLGLSEIVGRIQENYQTITGTHPCSGKLSASPLNKLFKLDLELIALRSAHDKISTQAKEARDRCQN